LLASDGGFPGGGVIADAAGNLYGTSVGGGYAYGTVYMLTRPALPGGKWTEATLHSFKRASEGLYPESGLIFDGAGNLFGTTTEGGNSACIGGCGVAFELTKPSQPGGAWTYTVLYRFNGGSDGDRPYWGSLIRDRSGNLFGMTVGGGSSTQCSGFGCGVVFELSPPQTKGGSWSEKIIHRFGSGTDGTEPFSGLMFDRDGNLFGTTFHGGSLNVGTVFELRPPPHADMPWIEKILYAFGGQNFDATMPTSTLNLRGGDLYGTTQNGGPICGAGGCGTVFRLKPTVGGSGWTEEILHSFNNADGNEAETRVIFDEDGNLYSTTYLGGTGFGNVFRLQHSGNTWTETTLHQFSGGTDGSGPVGNLIGVGRAIYGVTNSGGRFGAGTVYEIAP
jgi:uncharacterized repeat protein (TIGR03803 family)